MITTDRVPASMTIRLVVSTQIVKYSIISEFIICRKSNSSVSDCIFFRYCLWDTLSAVPLSSNRKPLAKSHQLKVPKWIYTISLYVFFITLDYIMQFFQQSMKCNVLFECLSRGKNYYQEGERRDNSQRVDFRA